MKRCPECRRDYYDDSLMYCLDDGGALLEGPASMDEPATAILHETAAPGEAPTRAQIHMTDHTAVSPTGTGDDVPKPRGFNKRLIVVPLLAILIVAAGYGGYRYFSTSGLKQIDSIAVMPFVNESGNADLDYLSDGMTDTLISSLSRLPGLNVKSRSSVFRYKGKVTDAKTVGKELGVQALLTGRVAQHGEQLTLAIELIDAATENVIWSDQYERRQNDLASLQIDIARDVSSKLRTRLSGSDEEKLARSHTTNSEAYLLFLKGRYYTSRYTEYGLSKGRDYLNQAIAADPTFARAYDGLAHNYITASDWYLSSKEALPRAGAAAKRALELDDQLADAHVSLATVKWWLDWDWPGAEEEFRRGIELDPNNARTLEFYGWYLIMTGRTDEGIELNRQGQRLDPLSAEMNTLYGQNLYFARRYDQAVEQLKATVEMDQTYWLAHSFLGRAYEQQGKNDLALSEVQKAFELEKAVPENAAMLGHAYAVVGNKAEARRILEQLRQSPTYVPAYNIAMVYIGLDARDEAFEYLQKAYEDRSFYITWLKCDPQLDRLRDDARFKDMLGRLNLPGN
jgi:TolB-like protein/lipoprotein NlpI